MLVALFATDTLRLTGYRQRSTEESSSRWPRWNLYRGSALLLVVACLLQFANGTPGLFATVIVYGIIEGVVYIRPAVKKGLRSVAWQMTIRGGVAKASLDMHYTFGIRHREFEGTFAAVQTRIRDSAWGHTVLLNRKLDPVILLLDGEYGMEVVVTGTYLALRAETVTTSLHGHSGRQAYELDADDAWQITEEAVRQKLGASPCPVQPLPVDF